MSRTWWHSAIPLSSATDHRGPISFRDGKERTVTLYHSPWFTLEPYPDVPLYDLLAPSAERFKDKPAFISNEGISHAFGDIWQACRRLGRFLQDNGLKKGDRVAIFSANASEYFVAFYGTLFAGGVVTTLNPL